MHRRLARSLRLRWLFCACSLWALLACGRIGVGLLDSGGRGCAGVACACPDGSPRSGGGVCGCGASADSTDDTDGDGVPDCVDFCPGEPDRGMDGTACGCAASAADQDGDGVANCDDRCPLDSAKSEPGSCGCGSAEADADSDAIPDCVDECADDPNKAHPGTCGCGTPDTDTDLDGTPDCMDVCSGADDSGYVTDDQCGLGYCQTHNQPSSCVAGVETTCQAAEPLSSADASCDGVDDDCDGRVDEDFESRASSCGRGVCMRTGAITCLDGQTSDSCTSGAPSASKDDTCDDADDDCDGKVDEDVAPVMSQCATGACLAMGAIACVKGQLVDSCSATAPISSVDTTCDNIDDDCNGTSDEGYVPSASQCGVGACMRSGMLTCVSGAVQDSCTPGTPAANDATCDGQDDDCDSRTDENYASSTTSCGVGACAASGTRSCSGGVVSDSCVPKAPAASDDAFSPGNGSDDDCDGSIDEDVPACNTTPLTFGAGTYTVSVPGNCHSVTVRLWGGGGGGGENDGLTGASAGTGGPGGYATAASLVVGTLALHVGGGSPANCDSAGTNAGSSSYNGGVGGNGTGANGADGMVAGGGSGADNGANTAGGKGYFGGGGGGEGNSVWFASGKGGGGGAASVFIVNGTRVAVAGGGGGGGGGAAFSLNGVGGAGGSGCGANGKVSSSYGGGGGGGGMCQGGSTQAGSGVTPAFSSDIPSGLAKGGAAACKAGGGGYAIVSFSP